MSHRLKLQRYQNPTRPDDLEGGLSSQERTLAVLLEQALRIKQEVAAGLQSAQGSVQVEALSRKLLENHMLTMTGIVKQLSMDIQALERQIAQRDSVTSGTTMAVQSLDLKNVAGIGDLRGRVTSYYIRCDAGIAKLSADMSSAERRLIRLQQEVAELRSAADVRLKELQVKVYHDLWRLEASLAENSQEQKISTADLQTQVKLLEARISGELKEAKEQTDSLRRRTEQQLNSLAQTHTESSQQQRMQLQDTMLEAESRSAVRLSAPEARVEQFEAQRGQTNRRQADQLKLGRRETSVESSLRQELQLLKQEYHKELDRTTSPVIHISKSGCQCSSLAGRWSTMVLLVWSWRRPRDHETGASTPCTTGPVLPAQGSSSPMVLNRHRMACWEWASMSVVT
ncbi:protein FAM81B [Anarrhichthys ocellatus]|uniref:protein FAM81B n=1 Tax=Anarrhichthys ocellatus TaxID=433405 RepID=UPI0012EEA5D9|nr:protein FAM81B [Anarrhichthys ocellatus]